MTADLTPEDYATEIFAQLYSGADLDPGEEAHLKEQWVGLFKQVENNILDQVLEALGAVQDFSLLPASIELMRKVSAMKHDLEEPADAS